MTNRLGLHIRIQNNSLTYAGQKAIQYGLTHFQCFLTEPKSNKLIAFTTHDITHFAQIYAPQFNTLFAHASYWSNMASQNRDSTKTLEKEIALARQAHFSHIVIHPGNAKGQTKEQGLQSLANNIDRIQPISDGLRLVLENTAHGAMSIGSDLSDFALLLNMVKRPEQIYFALDTAHAHVYGYDMSTMCGVNNFIACIEKNIGFSQIAILHINDTPHAHGSQIDMHATPGYGTIGIHCLQAFTKHPLLSHIPIVFELPLLSDQDEYNTFNSLKKLF